MSRPVPNTAVQLYRDKHDDLRELQEEIGGIAALLADVADLISDEPPGCASEHLATIMESEWLSLSALRHKLEGLCEAQLAVQQAWRAMTQAERGMVLGANDSTRIRLIGR